jgi:hypothetical protein
MVRFAPSSKETIVTNPNESPRPAEPVNPAEQSPAVEDLDTAKSVDDAAANLVKGGVKKTMQTQG